MKVEYTKQNYAPIYVKNSLFDTFYYNMISRLHVKVTTLLMWGLPLKTKLQPKLIISTTIVVKIVKHRVPLRIKCCFQHFKQFKQYSVTSISSFPDKKQGKSGTLLLPIS